MAYVIFGNHSSVIVPRQNRDSIRKFYCDILGGKITKEDNERDFLRLGENFYIGFLYEDVPDESEFLRTARSVWLEIKSENVEEMSRRILESGLVRKLNVPDPHLYFQAPGGNACGWSESTRTSHFMREPEKVRTWRRLRGPSGTSNDQMSYGNDPAELLFLSRALGGVRGGVNPWSETVL
jgi:hypothetical protein